MAAAVAPGGSPPVAAASGAGGPPARKAPGGERPRAPLHTPGLLVAPTSARDRQQTMALRPGRPPALPPSHWPDASTARPISTAIGSLSVGSAPFGSATSRIFPAQSAICKPLDLPWPAVSATMPPSRARSPRAPFQNVVSRLVMGTLLSGLGASCLSGCRSLTCLYSCPVCLFQSMDGEEVIRTAVFNWV